PVPVECAVESHSHSYLNCRSKNRGTQNFELPHNGLITLVLSMIIVPSIYNHNLGLVVVNTRTIRCTVLF
ncbi:unnamed protein product, partial [Callosobruchus maculatus]